MDLHVVAGGDLGHAIADRIAEATGARVDDASTPPEAWPEAAVRVLATWRPVPALEARIEELAFATATRWLPVICRQPFVQLGPFVDPAGGPCHACAKRRFVQHNPDGVDWMHLERAYGRRLEEGPRGYLPPHATLAASLALDLLESDGPGVPRRKGTVRLLDLLSLTARTGSVIGIHGCRTCGRKDDTGGGSLDRRPSDFQEIGHAGVDEPPAAASAPATASRIGSVVERDPQLRVPVRPKLVDGIVLLRHPDGILVDGVAVPQLLGGAGVESVLPELLPKLDGRRTLERICRELPDIPREALRAAVALLFTRGLLEEGRTTSTRSPSAYFFSRYADVTRVHPNADAAVRSLRDVAVYLEGDVEFGRRVCEELARMSVSVVDRIDDSTLAVALCATGRDETALSELDRRCSSWSKPWLRISWREPVLQVGPYFHRGHRSCYSCFTSTGLAGSTGSADAGSRPSGTHPRTVAALAATEIAYWITRICEPLSTTGLVELDLERWERRSIRVARRPGCPICMPNGWREPGVAVPMAHRYEDLVASSSKEFLTPRDHQIHYSSHLRALQRRRKRLPGAPLSLLPPPCPREIRPSVLDRTFLSCALSRAVGWKTASDGRIRRWAPSVGNLGSPHAYVRLDDDEGGSEFALYLPDRHALAHLSVALRRDIDTYRGAAVIFTAGLDRVLAKYGPLAYRLCLLDAGVAIAQLRAVADRCGISSAVLGAWDDRRVSNDLGLPPSGREPVTGVVVLGDVPDSFGSGNDPPPPRLGTNGVGPLAAMEELIEAVGESACGGPVGSSPITGAPIPDLFGLLDRRRSVRSFGPRPIASAVLGHAMRASLRADGFPTESVEAFVLANRVEGLKRGVYHCGSGDPEATRYVAPAPKPRALRGMLRQTEFGDAGAIVVFVGNLEESVDRCAEHGYRLLLLAGGAACYRAWLAALQRGLAGCIFEGPLAPDLHRLVGIDGWRSAPLVALALGHREEVGQEERCRGTKP